MDWCISSGRLDLLKVSLDELKYKCICAEHFPPQAFTNEMRKRLNWFAVPNLYEGDTGCNVAATNDIVIQAIRKVSSSDFIEFVNKISVQVVFPLTSNFSL